MFEKLIEAARTCHESGNHIDECCIEGCPNFDSKPYCLDQILKDCVEALTQSSAELKDKDYLIQQQADEIERQAALPWVTVPDKDDDELIRKLDMPAIVLAGGQYRVMDYYGKGYWTDEYGYLDRVESPYMVLPVSAIQP